MTTTYDPTTLIGQVRELIGDDNLDTDAGARPDGTNYSDETIANALAAHGNDVDLATARMCDMLAASWAAQGADVTIGRYRLNSGSKAEYYRELARKYRNKISFATF